MHEERDEPNRMSQLAGMIAMLSAVVKSLPPSTRERLMHRMNTEFELLLAGMPTARTPQSQTEAQTEREGVEWMRDFFLKQIAQADSKQKGRKVPAAKAGPGQRTARDTRSQADEGPSSPKIDFEL